MLGPQKNRSILCRPEEQGKYLAYNAETGTPLVMNAVSHFIWEMCDGQRDIGAITAELGREYTFPNDFEAEDLPEIVSNHIRVLELAGLIECE